MAAIKVRTNPELVSELRPIFEALDERGLTRTWLAGKLGLHRRQVSFYERGYVRAPDWFVVAACKVLDISPRSVQRAPMPMPRVMTYSMPPEKAMKLLPASMQTHMRMISAAIIGTRVGSRHEAKGANDGQQHDDDGEQGQDGEGAAAGGVSRAAGPVGSAGGVSGAGR